MNDDALRAMIREVVARRLATSETPRRDEHPVAFAAHASHFRYALPGSGEACLIEPAVQCTHCGYCQSHGH